MIETHKWGVYAIPLLSGVSWRYEEFMKGAAYSCMPRIPPLAIAASIAG